MDHSSSTLSSSKIDQPRRRTVLQLSLCLAAIELPLKIMFQNILKKRLALTLTQLKKGANTI